MWLLNMLVGYKIKYTKIAFFDTNKIHNNNKNYLKILRHKEEIGKI